MRLAGETELLVVRAVPFRLVAHSLCASLKAYTIFLGFPHACTPIGRWTAYTHTRTHTRPHKRETAGGAAKHSRLMFATRIRFAPAQQTQQKNPSAPASWRWILFASSTHVWPPWSNILQRVHVLRILMTPQTAMRFLLLFCCCRLSSPTKLFNMCDCECLGPPDPVRRRVHVRMYTVPTCNRDIASFTRAE